MRPHGTIVSNLARRIGDRLTAPCPVLDQAGIALPGRDDAYWRIPAEQLDSVRAAFLTRIEIDVLASLKR